MCNLLCDKLWSRQNRQTKWIYNHLNSVCFLFVFQIVPPFRKLWICVLFLFVLLLTLSLSPFSLYIMNLFLLLLSSVTASKRSNTVNVKFKQQKQATLKMTAIAWCIYSCRNWEMNREFLSNVKGKIKTGKHK